MAHDVILRRYLRLQRQQFEHIVASEQRGSAAQQLRLWEHGQTQVTGNTTVFFSASGGCLCGCMAQEGLHTGFTYPLAICSLPTMCLGVAHTAEQIAQR